jgi:hypothetical protein
LLITLPERLIKIGTLIVRHGTTCLFEIAEEAVPRALFAAIRRQINSAVRPTSGGSLNQ